MISLSPEEYFDPLGPGENYWDHGVETNLVKDEYVPVGSEKVKWFIIIEKQYEDKRTFRCQNFDGGSSRSTHTVDENGNEEIITQSLVAPETWHSIRTRKPHDGHWATYMDNISSEIDVDGIYRNDNLMKNWSFEEAKEFSYVESKDL